MTNVADFKWSKDMKLNKFTSSLGKIGFQSTEIMNASNTIVKMKTEGAKIFLSFTSNMVTSGLRGFFAQLIDLKIANIIITTVGGIEEDIMKAKGEDFPIGSFFSDDKALYERGHNRVGNLIIKNESYEKFEDMIDPMLEKLYAKKKRYTVSELLYELGLQLNDKNSILYQASKHNVPIFCPAITDGAFGFHLYSFSLKHKDFIVDVVGDFSRLLSASSYDEKKGLIALGGGVSKHHAILGTLINGGLDYAIYMTTANYTSGSMSGATTQEAKSWGKIKDDADAVTVIGDVSVFFPLAMCGALEELSERGVIEIKK
ncbi:MAG: deoxyhypusine synthase family protein [Candidatus Aenigmarchaeota archaeon]|nr:deoxyhypusine synthase family protein [Candidatus Aenigmarchaeota archaeon]